jgi:type IX secretion system substrate protein
MKKSIFCSALLLFLCIANAGMLRAQTISTIAGNGLTGYTGDGGPATAAKLNRPYCVYVDAAGNMFIGDVAQELVRKVSSAGIISTFAGGGVGLGDGGPATAAQIFNPTGITGDAAGNIYIADAASDRVRMVNTAGIIYTFAGTGLAGHGGDGLPATAATFTTPTGLAIDGAGNIFISAYGDSRVRKVAPSGIITTLAGDGTPGFSGDGSPATAAELHSPWGIAADAAGNVYITDVINNDVRKVSVSGIITTMAGNDTMGFRGDGGPATAAEFDEPYGVAVDATGNVYVLDQANERIRKINTSGIIHTYAGTGATGYSGDGGLATLAGLFLPYGIAIDGPGNLYIADDLSARIRYVTDTLTLGAVTGVDTVCPGNFVTLSDTTSGGVWSSSNTGIATVGSATGIVTGIAFGTAIISYTKFGISVIDTVYIPHIVPVPITGPSSVCADSSITLHNAVSGGVWSSSNSLAAVGSTGVVTAGPTAGIDTISYTFSNACGTDTATFRVTVLPPGSCITLSANTTSVTTYGLKVFPNPGNGDFTLLLSSAVNEQATVIITNISGRIVKELTMTGNTAKKITLKQAPGLYFISATTANGRYEGKITLMQ